MSGGQGLKAALAVAVCGLTFAVTTPAAQQAPGPAVAAEPRSPTTLPPARVRPAFEIASLPPM